MQMHVCIVNKITKQCCNNASHLWSESPEVERKVIKNEWNMFIGLHMDVHNQQLIFPTIVVCPIESYDSNRTYDLAFSKLG